MSDQTIGVLQATSPDRLLDAEELTVGANTVVRERNRVAGAAAAELADVKNSTPGATDYGLVVRQVDNTVKAASTAAVAADKALVVAISPNNGAKVTDGTNTAAVKAASTAAVATDPALVVAISPNNTVPVSAASLPLPAGAATSSNQTTINTQTTMINDGTNTATVKAASTAAVAADKALVVAINPQTAINLPTGASTASLQSAGNTTLAQIAGQQSAQATTTNQTNIGTQTTMINDGTNTATVKAASTAAVAADKALVVAVSPNNTVTVAGAKTNNNAAPGATNEGVIPALANAAAPAWTEGNLVLLSADLIGNLRVREPESTLMVTATAAVNTGFTLTLPAAGAGLFHYITSIHIVRASTAALAGTATLTFTTTNLPGNPVWTVGNAMVAGGTQLDLNLAPCRPLKSSVANTATTIVAPACGAAVLSRINVTYYTAP